MVVNLDHLGLLSGQATTLTEQVEIGSIELGGHSYVAVPDPITARLDVSRTVAGYAMRLRFECRAEGPCMRCLDPASQLVAIDVREVDQPSPPDEDGEIDPEGEMSSPYMDGGRLDLGAWARDALVLTMPEPHLCDPGCEGLCPVCGERLAGSEPGAHDHERSLDPRWAALDKLRTEEG
jgi:uncharacterized protein